MGYAWNGICYADAPTALNAFIKSIPAADASGINTFAATPTVSGTGLITWAIVNRPLSSTSAATRTGTTQLPQCSEAATLLPSSITVPESVVFCVMAIMFAIGFRTGVR